MNLINDTWLPVIRQDGTHECIAPWQIAETNNPVIELAAPRADFQGALYQFLIGLLQAVFAAADEDVWLQYWENAPDSKDLKDAFERFAPAFHLDNPDGPAFMQDFDLPEGEQKPVASLLIEAPGGKTRKDNLDHFIKGGSVNGVCFACAATALFTLQINAPSGGVGHRVGLRGGGPLTTLVMPTQPNATLWQKLWLNVLTEEEFCAGNVGLDSSMFPWLAPTRISDKTGSNTMPEDVHPLQMYWGMPRRIRLQTNDLPLGECTLCGCENTRLIKTFLTRNYGVNYEGPWVHPLTPYRFDSKKSAPPISLKGQQGGLGYRHWLGLAWQDDSTGDKAARIVQQFNAERAWVLNEGYARLWCFGYDMDNMKARCWYEYRMPLLKIAATQQENVIGFASLLLQAAKDTVFLLRSTVKAAWFNRPSDVKGDMSMVDQSFWHATEAEFYRQLHALVQLPEGTRQLPPGTAEQWLKTLRTTAYKLFDTWVLEGNAEDQNLKRITKARRILSGKLFSTKSLKDLNTIAHAKVEAA